MKIKSIKPLPGANVYSHNSVILVRLAPEDRTSRPSRKLAGFNARLLETLPRLKEHFCRSNKKGGFCERLRSGTHFNHVFEHVLLELLSQAGDEKRFGNFCGGSELDISKAVIETTAVETARYLVPAAVELIDAVAEEKSFLLEEKILEAKEIYSYTELGPSTKIIVEAAERRGIPWTREDDLSLVQLGYGKNLRLVRAAATERTSMIAADMAGDKDATKKRLEKFSIPVPYGLIARSADEAAAAFERIGAPVVVKPLDGRQGRGVSLDLTTRDEVVRAFELAKEFSRRVLVEEFFEGKNYRVLVIGGKLTAASERMPCYITGDGQHSIAELIEIENRNPLRGEGHEKPLTKIKLNPILTAALEKEGWKLEDAPPFGERITLCAGMNLSTGGTARDVTDEVHPQIRAICERAARILNLDICGVDLVVGDIAAEIPKTKGGIIEINAAPGFRMHVFPSEGAPRDVGAAVVEMLYPEGASARIPIISITGTNGKTTVTRMISYLLKESGVTVGTTTTDGIFINGERIVTGDTTGPISARTVLGDRAVEAAVLETARGGIVRRGLGYDWSDISVLTNIDEDHIGQDGIESVEDIINIKSLVAERLRAGGTLVINADDPNCLRVLEREKVKALPRKIVYFSLDENNPVVIEHISKGGLAYFPSGGRIVEQRGLTAQSLLEIGELPFLMNGAAEFQIANVLAAAAAARAYGLSVEALSAMKTFDNAAHNPGRNNLYRVGGGYALIDYGHNAAAFEAVCKMAAGWTDRRVTGVIGVPGDRDDDIIIEAARIAARGFHRIIVKEDADLRGREKGETARLLCDAVKREAPDRPCEIVLDEVEAFSNALAGMRDGEVVVLFYDKLKPVLDVLENFGAVPAVSIEKMPTALPEAAPV